MDTCKSCCSRGVEENMLHHNKPDDVKKMRYSSDEATDTAMRAVFSGQAAAAADGGGMLDDFSDTSSEDRFGSR